MLIFSCNVIKVSLLYVHAKSAGWKIWPRPKTIILKIKKGFKMIQLTMLVSLLLCLLEESCEVLETCSSPGVSTGVSSCTSPVSSCRKEKGSQTSPDRRDCRSSL